MKVSLIVLGIVGVVRGGDVCSSFNSDADLGYWAEIEGTCWPCLRQAGCGFCLSTLRCAEGTSMGPTVGACPDWLGPSVSLIYFIVVVMDYC